MWSDDLPLFVEVCPIELPGRGMRFGEHPFTQLEPLIQSLSQAILPSLTKPFVFFGHSMGALVSFELTRLLCQKHPLNPLHLFVSGHRAPHIPDPDPPINLLPEPEFLKELRRYNGIPDEVFNNTELMQVFIPTLRADFAVVETYAYAPSLPLNCPITVFGGIQDWKTNRDNLEAWQEQTHARFSLQFFPGDHFFLHSARSLLLQSLTKQLRLLIWGD